MIRLFVGKPGSGKTISAVKEMCMNSDSQYVSNIKTHKIKNNINIKPTDLIKKTIVKIKKDGTPVYKYEFNKEYWIKLKKKNPMLNIFLDEIHTAYDARRSSSHQTKIINDFIALIRKIISNQDAIHGCFTMITQLDRRIDVIGIEMANQIRYHICHYKKRCRRCNTVWRENNETPIQLWKCPTCQSKNILKYDSVVYAYYFDNITNYMRFIQAGAKSYFKRTIMTDTEYYYDKYNSFQWEDLLAFE